MSRRSTAAFACPAPSAPTLVACGHNSTSADTMRTIKTVASATQICDYATQLASGDAFNGLSFDRIGAGGKAQHFGADAAKAKSHLKLTCLLASNASAHEHGMTTTRSKALLGADLFFIPGVNLEHFLDSTVDSTGFEGTMVVAFEVAGAADIDDLTTQKKKEETKPYKVDRGSAEVEVAKWPFLPEEGKSEPEFCFDPHAWTSPKNAIIQVASIGAALEKAAPDQTGISRSHVDAYVAKLKKLDEWAANSFNSVPQDRRVLFTSHGAFGYFSKEFGVKFEDAAPSDFNAQQDVTADKIQQTADKVESSGAVAVLVENSNNPKSIQKVAEVAGIKAVIGDEALYSDSLGTPGSDGEAYIGSVLRNASNLTKAWGGTVAEIPIDLAQWTSKTSDIEWGTVWQTPMTVLPQ